MGCQWTEFRKRQNAPAYCGEGRQRRRRFRDHKVKLAEASIDVKAGCLTFQMAGKSEGKVPAGRYYDGQVWTFKGAPLLESRVKPPQSEGLE